MVVVLVTRDVVEFGMKEESKTRKRRLMRLVEVRKKAEFTGVIVNGRNQSTKGIEKVRFRLSGRLV